VRLFKKSEAFQKIRGFFKTFKENDLNLLNDFEIFSEKWRLLIISVRLLIISVRLL
jgi:hypothetical protein